MGIHLAQFLNRMNRIIIPPRAGTGINDHHITLADGFGQLLSDQLQIIRQNRITASDTIIFRDQIFKHPGIGFYNFPIFQWFRIFNHLITGRNNSNHRFFYHFNFCNSRRYKHRNVNSPYPVTGWEYHFFSYNVLSYGPHMGKGMGRGNNCISLAVFRFNQIFRHDHRIIGRHDHITCVHIQIVFFIDQSQRMTFRSSLCMRADNGDSIHGPSRLNMRKCL